MTYKECKFTDIKVVLVTLSKLKFKHNFPNFPNYNIFLKIVLLPFLAAILNFSVKRKNTLSWKGCESTGVFFHQKCFPTIFGSLLEFLHKKQNNNNTHSFTKNCILAQMEKNH